MLAVGGSVGLAEILAEHFGLVLFTVLSIIIVGYLAYTMLKPERV